MQFPRLKITTALSTEKTIGGHKGEKGGALHISTFRFKMDKRTVLGDVYDFMPLIQWHSRKHEFID
jgi:hypothetical protein